METGKQIRGKTWKLKKNSFFPGYYDGKVLILPLRNKMTTREPEAIHNEALPRILQWEKVSTLPKFRNRQPLVATDIVTSTFLSKWEYF